MNNIAAFKSEEGIRVEAGLEEAAIIMSHFPWLPAPSVVFLLTEEQAVELAKGMAERTDASEEHLEAAIEEVTA